MTPEPVHVAQVVEPCCPDCGEIPPQFERVGADWFCQTCGHIADVPRMTERMLRDARLAKLLFVKRPHEGCDDDPDPDYGL